MSHEMTSRFEYVDIRNDLLKILSNKYTSVYWSLFTAYIDHGYYRIQLYTNTVIYDIENRKDIHKEKRSSIVKLVHSHMYVGHCIECLTSQILIDKMSI